MMFVMRIGYFMPLFCGSCVIY